MHRGADGELEVELPAERELDHLLARVFDGVEGSERLERCCGDYDRVVGKLFDDDDRVGALRLLRADWALCEVRRDTLVHEAQGLAEVTAIESAPRWIDACAAGQVAGVDPSAAQRIARSVVGAFELWVGKELWLRDRVRGICARLLDEVAAPTGTDPTRPSALWDARIVLDPKGARLCRAPFVYPDSALEALQRAQRGSVPGAPKVGMPQMRRAWLRWARARRRQPFEL